ncbi:MAG: ankyrin repeat domain-containing protein [Chlamydiia bacterium]|nr:ankyrin repeat domain-containing protein [Chlamydiia bacterium]
MRGIREGLLFVGLLGSAIDVGAMESQYRHFSPEITPSEADDVSSEEKTPRAPLNASQRMKYALLYNVIDPNQVSATGKSLLEGALESAVLDPTAESLEIIHLLLENGACINCILSNGETPLTFALGTKNIELIREVMIMGPDYTFSNVDGDTPLHIAIQTVNEPIFKYLLAKQRKNSLSKSNQQGETPLDIAIQLGLQDFAIQLVDLYNIRDLDRESGCGCTPLMLAIEEGNSPNIVKALISRGVRIDQTSSMEGRTALHYAAQNGNLWALEYLIANGAEIDVKDFHGVTPLYLALDSDQRRLNSVALLLDRGAAIDQIFPGGETALHFAAAKGDTELGELLLERGAALEARNSRRQTPLYVAARSGQQPFVMMLVERGAKLQESPSPLSGAILSEDPELVQYFLKQDTIGSYETNR